MLIKLYLITTKIIFNYYYILIVINSYIFINFHFLERAQLYEMTTAWEHARL